MHKTICLILLVAITGANAANWWEIFFRTTTSRPITTSGPLVDPSSIACGRNIYMDVPSTNQNQGIVGGTDAASNEFPWQVGIQYRNSFICGGSIVSKRHIVTAAHCIIRNSPRSFKVVVGDHSRRSSDHGEATYQISNIAVHPGYNQRSNSYDMAVLTTSSDMTFDQRYVRPVCLPNGNLDTDSFVGQMGFISGWGQLDENGPGASTLQKANVPVQSQSTCQQSYGRSSITNDMMCAGYTSGGVDSCQGDSGGPLVIYDRSKNQFFLQGVTSWYVLEQHNQI